MTNYAYIENLFREILKQSKAIRGNFHIAWRYGLQDINYDNFGQVLDTLPTASNKWPAVIMAPPHSNMRIGGRESGWEEFRLLMFFMNNSQDQSVNPSNKTAQHSILEDWHDMKRCAVNFLNALRAYQDATLGQVFQLPIHQVLFIPLSMVGADKVSGMRVDFDFRLFVGCEVEDYIEYPTNLEIDLDGHPEHDIV